MLSLTLLEVARASTNTNTCIADMEGIQACQTLDFAACCDAVRTLAVDRCECNPAIDVLLSQAGPVGGLLYQLEPLCRIGQPFKWIGVPLRALRSCTEQENGKSYGCEESDVAIDGHRLAALLGFMELFSTAQDESVCFDTNNFEAHLETIFLPDAGVKVPYGIGTYSGYSDMAEYLGIAFSGLNHGFWEFTNIMDGSAKSFMGVTEDGAEWALGTTQFGTFLRGVSPYTDSYVLQVARFSGCDTRVSALDVVPTEDFRDSVEAFVQTSELSKRWGVEDICRYHTKWCSPDEATRQFASEQACMDYMRALPLFTPACGVNRPLSGHSLPCKFKHHFMVPTNPALHCPHIGPLGAADVNGKHKCDDSSECAGIDDGQDDWPEVAQIGDATPPEVLEAYARSNEGWETEPFGCAL